MKLLTSPTSPFALKVLMVAHELGIASRIELEEVHVSPYDRNRAILDLTPLAQVPTLVLDGGRSLYDSRVICEYLDATFGAGALHGEGESRWRALTEQTIGDGLMAAALIARYERMARPAGKQWNAWLDGHLDKIVTVLAHVEDKARSLAGRVDIGTITLACAFAYVDFRFADLDRAARFPKGERWYVGFRQRKAISGLRLG